MIDSLKKALGMGTGIYAGNGLGSQVPNQQSQNLGASNSSQKAFITATRNN